MQGSFTFQYCLQLRQIQTSAQRRDIDQAAKYIGAGAATVGVAGSGNYICANRLIVSRHSCSRNSCC